MRDLKSESIRKRRGFSLLEIVVALAVAMLILGAATLTIGSVNAEHRIRKSGGAIETAARAMLLDAVSEKRERILVLDENRLTNPETGTSIELPNTEIAIGSDWKTPNNFRWRFLAGGICEPIRIRLRTDSAVMEMTFDTLTGESMEESVTVTK